MKYFWINIVYYYYILCNILHVKPNFDMHKRDSMSSTLERDKVKLIFLVALSIDP